MSDQSVNLSEVKLSVAQSTPAPATPAVASPNMDARMQSVQVSPAESPQGSTASDPHSEAQKGSLDRGLLERQVEEANRDYERRNISISFSIDEDSESLVIKVMDTNTDKVIRQIPPEELLAIRRQMHEVLGGIFDAQA